MMASDSANQLAESNSITHFQSKASFVGGKQNETTSLKAEKHTISFVIPAFNEGKWIEVCVQAIRALKLPENLAVCEVIVVDNESTDETAAIAIRLGAKVVSCRPGKPAIARNLGAKSATGDWLAFVDADCELDSDWLVEIGEIIGSEGTLAAGSNVLPPVDAVNWVSRTLGELSSTKTRKDQPVSRPKRWLPTAGLVVKREAFERVNGFDETLETCEDCEFGYRLSELGQMVEIDNAQLIHHGESSSLWQLFRREAWRSADNLRLAFQRPADVRNWISLVVPPVVVACVLVGLLGVLGSFWLPSTQLNGSRPAFLTVLFVGLMASPAIVIKKADGRIGFRTLARRSIVMATFLAGRTVGLFRRFSRVER